MKSLKDWGLRLSLVVLAILWLALVVVAWAEARAEAAQEVDPEYNFSWLDPDKKIYVLQNRKYLKTMRPLLSVTAGLGFSNPYRSSYNLDPRVAFYIREAWGVEAFYTFTFNSRNNTFNALLNTQPNVSVVVREITAMYGGLVHWVPWYAKINVFNKILYVDWYFSGGAGAVNSTVSNPGTGVTTQQQLFSTFFGTGHLYHLSQALVVRLDFTGALYPAPLLGTSGETVWYTNYNIGLGIGLKI